MLLPNLFNGMVEFFIRFITPDYWQENPLMVVLTTCRNRIGANYGNYTMISVLPNNRLKLTAHQVNVLSARSLAWALDGLKSMVINVAIDYVLMGEANYYIVGKTNISVVLGGSGDLI